MAELNQIIIHQTLHGYKEGHKLLASSTDLTPIEKNALLLLSDYSGSGKENNFSKYLTGYPLPNTKFYAFATTWYAAEMPRPGCVWTHTLLIDISILWTIEDVLPLIQKFVRPGFDNYDYYAQPLLFFSKVFLRKNTILKKEFFELSCHYYSNQKNIIILSDSSTLFEDPILQIWSFQWPKLKRSFKFCTGSLSPRTLMNDSFDLQVLPFTRERFLNKSEREKFKIIEFGKFSCVDNLLNTYNQVDLTDVLAFMTRFGADAPASKNGFISLLRAYFFVKQNLLNDENVIQFLTEYFSEPSEAKALKSYLIEILFQNPNDNKYFLIHALLQETAFSQINWDFRSLIGFAWQRRLLFQNQLMELLQGFKRLGLEIDLLELLKVLPLTLWVNATELYASVIDKLVSIDNIVLDINIWFAKEEVQILWWHVLKSNLDKNLQIIVRNMLTANNGLYAQELLKTKGEVIFNILFTWILEFDSYPVQDWQYLVKVDPIAAFRCLNELDKANIKMFLLFPNILSPSLKEWKYLNLNDFKVFFNKLSQIKDEITKSALYTFFLTSCFSGSIENPEKLAAVIFDPLHRNLQNDIYELGTWQRFKFTMSRDLYDLAELDFFSKIFSERLEIPEWDRCEFLRRSLISCYVVHNWEIETIVEIVSDEKTFKKILEFGLQVKPVKKLLKGLRTKLASSVKQKSFHYDLLKKHL